MSSLDVTDLRQKASVVHQSRVLHNKYNNCSEKRHQEARRRPNNHLSFAAALTAPLSQTPASSQTVCLFPVYSWTLVVFWFVATTEEVPGPSPALFSQISSDNKPATLGNVLLNVQEGRRLAKPDQGFRVNGKTL